MQKEIISIFGDETHGGCLIYIVDIAEGNVAALRKEAENQIFNLAGAQFITINHVIQNLGKIFGDVKVGHEPSRPEDFIGAKVNIKMLNDYQVGSPRRGSMQTSDCTLTNS